MVDPQDVEAALSPSEAANAENEVKTKDPRQKKPAKAQQKRSVGKKGAAVVFDLAGPDAKKPRKVYSDKERSHVLAQIEKSIASGKSIKSATAHAGVSVQAYYQWKKTAAPVPEGGELKDLLALEEENTRLKQLLAERLRNENAELKKKLGLNGARW